MDGPMKLKIGRKKDNDKNSTLFAMESFSFFQPQNRE
jgi:hypothetical protein